MAEVVGLVVGLAPIAVNVIGGIDRLREIRQRSIKAPDDLDFVLQELKFLELVLKQAGSVPHFTHLPGFQHCKASCDAVAKGIEDLLEKLPPASSFDEKKPKWKDTWNLRHWKQDVDELKRNVEKAKQDLSLLLGLNSMLRESQHLSVVVQGSARISSPSKPSTTKIMRSQGTSMVQKPWDCSVRACSCSCQSTSTISQRFWVLEYLGLGLFNQSCDKTSCTSSSYGLSLRLALSQLGIPWSVIMSFHVSASMGSYGIRPALQIEQVVRYTSPGFEILYELRSGLISTQTACEDFRQLAQTDRSLRHHVNPAGYSYVEVIVNLPQPLAYGLFNLLAMLVCELQISRGMEKRSFLRNYALHYTTPQYMEVLEAITKCGVDLTTLDSPRASEWPRPDLFRPVGPTLPDPFYIHFLTVMCKDNPGFAGMTPLHDAVLFQSPEMSQDWCGQLEKDEKNFLGQTPLHLATSRPQHLTFLLEAGHDPNSIDAYGFTPLMYAAVLNQVGAVKMLLCAGADPCIRDPRFNYTFVYCAAVCKNWQLIIAALGQIKMARTDAIADVLSREALFCHFKSARKQTFPYDQILPYCRSLNFSITDPSTKTEGNTLLHYARSPQDADFLLSHGFEKINRPNSAGRHALMAVLCPSLSSELIDRLLDGGADANLQDKNGHTTIHHLINHLCRYGRLKRIFWSVLDSLHVIVARGADVLVFDHCRCACSASGCLPATILSVPVPFPNSTRLPIICLIEWTTLVLESRGLGPAKETVLAFIRRAEHQELGMTHLCCRGRFSPSADFGTPRSTTPEDDIDEILEEESDFSKILSEKMQEVSTKELGSLLKFAMLYDKDLCDFSRKDAAGKDIFVPRHYWSGFDVDHKNDRFVNRWSDRTEPHEILMDMSRYAGWMERRFRTQDSSQPSLCKEQYFRRLSWLYYIGNLCGISVADIVQETKNANLRSGTVGSVSCEDYQDIPHFRKSWEEWSAQGPAMRNISTVGFANWPFVEADE